MANESIKSLNDAQKRIADLKRQISDWETQVKELEHRYPEFVDNPAHPLNRPFTLNKNSVLYLPTLDKNRHFPMKFEDLCKHFDQYHYPLYFTDEESCSIFDSIFPILSDLIAFKVRYDSGANMVPSRANPVYCVYLDTESNPNTFRYDLTENRAFPMVYFSSEAIANNCCTWLNYKYKMGNYATK